ncbi:MAG: amidohydrolase [Gammaproteobacteria bacterium]|jgi:aminobenzoyl-glutamate utilization protein B|nr:amidohydrolase [Gammaproteobacteria bacterium]
MSNLTRSISVFFLLISILNNTYAADKAKIIENIDARFQAHQDIALKIYDYAELGYLENKSSALLKNTLRDAGFRLEEGVANIPTAFIAEAGEGKPVIALLAEFDALPGITQSADPFRNEIPAKASGHACGHHLFGTASLGAAIAIKEWLEKNNVKGTVRLYGTPAEEGGSGKVYMVREGLFKDVDTVLSWHPGSENVATVKPSLANRSAKFRFHGVSAHAAAAPHKARSALDGVEAFNNMVNLLREHVPQETRIHYVITEGGHAPNVVPDFAEVYYYVRHPFAENLKSIWSRVEQAAKGAAMGTGTTVDWEIIHGNHSMLPSKIIATVMDKNLKIVGGVAYSKKEQEFAEKIYLTLNSPELALGSEKIIQPIKYKGSMGSTDVGDISWNVPTGEFRSATWVPGTSAHSWQAIAAGGMSIGVKGMQVSVKTLALTAIDLFENAELVKKAKAELQKRRGKGFKYEPLLGDRAPPLDYRK